MCLQLAGGPPWGPKYDIHLTLHAGPRMQRDLTTKPRASLCYVTPPTYVTPPRPTCTSQLPSLAALGICYFFLCRTILIINRGGLHLKYLLLYEENKPVITFFWKQCTPHFSSPPCRWGERV